MKLKYYLRGLGMGILFATIVMMVHNNNLPAEKIIEEAKKLGMVMPEDTEDKGGLWGNKEDSEQETQNNSQSSTEHNLPTSAEDVSESESQMVSDTQNISDSQISTDSQELSDTQMSMNTEEIPNSQQSGDIEQVSDTLSDSEQLGDNQEVTYVTIKINAKNSAERVCRILYQNGLIDSEEGFHAYLQEMGYTHIIQKGTFNIPMGATYEEICAIIIKREYL